MLFFLLFGGYRQFLAIFEKLHLVTLDLGYTQVAILTEPSTRKASSGHLSQAEIPPVSLT